MGLYEIAKQQAKIEGYDIDESLAEANAKRHIGRLESRAGTTKLTGQELSSLTNGASYEDVSSMIERPWNPLHEDIPYLMAENQSVGAKIGGFANQLQGEIIGGAIEGFGYLGDVAHWGNRLSGGEGDWGNWLSDIGTSYKDLTRDLTPIYQRNPNEGFDPGDFGWWMSNAVSVGSSLSLLIPAAGATMALGKLGKMTGMLDKAVKLGSKLGLAAESTKMLGTVMGRAMFSRHMENMMEANGTFDEIKNKQLQLGKSEEEATRLASGGAADVYRNNWPLVIQDIAQMALIAKGPNFTKAVDSAAVATAAGMSAKGALLKAGYTKGWDMLTEGAEEAYQFVVGEEAKYSVDVATGLKPKSNFGDRLGEYAKDGHLWTSALFGALGAGVMQAAGPLVNKLTSGEYNPETAARVEEIKTRGVTYAAASKLYREAANADSKEGIEHASDFMALDLVTRAEATGNLDLQFKQLDDFKTMSKEERAAENFDEGMVERIDDIKSRMQEIVEMSKNIRKTHDPLVRYNVAMRMLQNKRFNKTLQESKVNESVNTNAIPRHSDLSSFGKSSLNDILDLNAVNSAIAATSQMLQGNITDFAKSKLEQTLKNYEAKRDAIAAKLDSEEANTNITEEDRKIIDSYQNSPFVDKVIVDKVKTIIAKDAIDRNNEEIAHLGSKEGIEDYKRVVAKARKKQADKDAKDAQDKLDADNAAADALVKAKSKEEELGKLTTELTPSDEELLKSMPEGHLIGKTDAELQAIADKQGLELSDVKVWQQADIEAFNKLKEAAANTAKTKAQEKLAEASKTNDAFIPTADNTTQIDFTESLPERESPKITTGHALAWKSSGNATSSELDKLNNKELSNFLEDPNIDLSAYDVVFSIDEEKLEKESKYEGVADQLAAGNFENIGEVPVKGVFHLNGVPVLSPSGKPYTVYIHDSTYEYFAEQHKEDAIAEAIALKTAVVAAKPGTTISTKIVNKSKGHLNVDKQGNKFIFHSLTESINDKSDKLEFAIGGNGGIYLNTAENKDIHNSLVGLLSARPGAVYTLVKTANGKVVPIRTWVSKLDEQEATLLYNTYKDILNKPQEYQNKLSKEFKEANASILTSLPINTATITYKELLEFFVFEGALTKDMGGRQLYTTKDGTLHIAGEVIDIQTMNTPEGMTKFVNLITAGNFRQISRTKLADNSYKAYVSKNNILTTNVVKVNNNIFVQPTLTIGKLESKSTPVEQQAEVVSDAKADIERRRQEELNNSDLYHTGDNLTLENISVEPRVTRQGRKGKYGGLYTYDNLGDIETFSRGNSTKSTFGITLNEGVEIKEYTGSIERLSKEKLEELRQQGYQVVKGKSLLGKTEIIIIDKSAIKSIESHSEINAKYDAELAALEGAKPADITKSDEDLIREQMNKMGDDAPFRVKLDQDISEFEKEDWPKIEEFMKKNFPMIPLYRVKNIIRGLGGIEAWGMLKNGGIYVYENAEVGTAYHEVFEAVWKLFSSSEERINIINEFKNRSGSFIDRVSGDNVKYSEATDYQIKEQLAEEFRDFVKDGKVPVKPTKGQPFIVKLFNDIVNFIKTFFYGPQAARNTEELFKRMNTGFYSKQFPARQQLSYARAGVIDVTDAFADRESETRIKGFVGGEVNDIMQEMTYQTLQKILRKGNNIFDIGSSKLPKKAFYEELKESIQMTALKSRKAAQKLLDSDKISKEAADVQIEKSNSLWKRITDNWSYLVEKHEEYLASYNIEFDDNAEMVLNDDKVKEDAHSSPEKIDNFRKANSAVKLLLSSIPIVRDGNLVYTSINGAKLIPTSEVYMAIINRTYTATNPDEMFENLRQLAIDDEN